MAVKTNEIRENNLSDELLEVLLSLASKCGDAVDEFAFKVVNLNGAMTNKVFRVSWPTKTQDTPRTVLVRVYGEGVEIFFDRDEEIQTFEYISNHDHGPKLLGQFKDGRIEEFIHAKTLSADDLRDAEISALIAAKLREFHNLEMPGPKNVVLWERMRNWLRHARCLASPEQAKEFGLDDLDREIGILEMELSRENQEIGFCHNDLQYGNIMIDEEARWITIIDYEYASYNPVAYDIANHFCEMAANYHTDTPHVLKYDAYPGREERQKFIRLYLTSEDHQPSDAEVEKLVEDVEKYTLANHLFWGLWGIISAYGNTIEFNYMEYARQRFQQYKLKKKKLLHLNDING